MARQAINEGSHGSWFWIAEDPWAGLPIDPTRLPPSGDQAWLDVHRSLAGWHG